jgi:hypothetical protein
MAFALFAAGACTQTPAIQAGVCGNHVIEGAEDCDTFAPAPGQSCRPPGSVGACHIDCRPDATGARPACPAGWGCNVDGFCLRPSGAFVALPESKVGDASLLLSGDFDGDGRADVISRPALDTAGGARMRFHYFDQGGALAESRLFVKSVSSPSVADLSGDGRSDVVFSNRVVGALRGQSDRSTVPETCSSYHFPDASVRMVGVYHAPIQNISSVVSLTTIGGTSGFYIPDATGVLRLRAAVPAVPSSLAGDPVRGNIVEAAATSPCDELVFAVAGATSFSMVDACTRDPATDEVIWRDQFAQATVTLDPPAPVDGAPLVADIDGDGHLDVLVGAAGRAYLARGDGAGLATAIPFNLPLANPTEVPPAIPMPLAAGDFTGDGAVDFVFPDYLLASSPAPSGALPVYQPLVGSLGVPWTVARIADFNGNGFADVAAASSGRTGIDFFNGSGTGNLTPFSVATDQPVRFLAVGDFDGDLLGDLAIVEAPATPADPDALAIAFGNPAGPPSPAAPVARIAGAEQLSAFSEEGISNLLVASRQAVGGRDDGVLAVLPGSGDRLPYAPCQLVSITDTGQVFSSAAAGVVAGGLTGAGHHDVFALATDGFPETNDYNFWILSDMLTPAGTISRVGGKIDPRLRPVIINGMQVSVRLAGAAADVNGDGRDEVLWAIPADQDARCGLIVTGVGADGSLQMDGENPVVINEPCLGPQLVPVDADGDGWVDVALLTGAPGVPGRKIYLLWNDGRGGFSSASAAFVSSAGDSPEQMAVVPATPQRALGIAYVTDSAALLATVSGPRQFATPLKLADVQHGTGIVAADVNGDGVTDLVVAASGNLRVLAAQLVSP